MTFLLFLDSLPGTAGAAGLGHLLLFCDPVFGTEVPPHPTVWFVRALESHVNACVPFFLGRKDARRRGGARHGGLITVFP